MRKNFVQVRGGGLVICRWGELGLGRRRRNGGGEGRQIGHKLTFSDGFTDGVNPSVYPPAILTGKQTRHRTNLLFQSLGDSVGIVDGEPVTSPVRVCHFKSVGDSVCIFDGEPVPSPVRVTRFESVGDSVGNITRQNLHVSDPPFFS